MIRRRRPLLRAAAVGTVAGATAGAVSGHMNRKQAEAQQDAYAQQQGAQEQADAQAQLQYQQQELARQQQELARQQQQFAQHLAAQQAQQKSWRRLGTPPRTGPLNPWGRFLYAVIGRGRSSSSQGDAVGLAPAAAPEGEDDGVGDGLGLEPGLGLGFVSGRATVSACLRGQALFQHNASVWSPTVVSAGIAAATLKPPLWSAVKVASS